MITELRIKLHNEQVENSLDLMDKHIFYAQSKHTHTMAKESYNDLVNILESNLHSTNYNRKLYGEMVGIWWTNTWSWGFGDA